MRKGCCGYFTRSSMSAGAVCCATGWQACSEPCLHDSCSLAAKQGSIPATWVLPGRATVVLCRFPSTGTVFVASCKTSILTWPS